MIRFELDENCMKFGLKPYDTPRHFLLKYLGFDLIYIGQNLCEILINNHIATPLHYEIVPSCCIFVLFMNEANSTALKARRFSMATLVICLCFCKASIIVLKPAAALIVDLFIQRQHYDALSQSCGPNPWKL